MKEIPLTRGKVALVDDEDFESLSRFKWQASQESGIWYARRGHKTIRMHTQIMGGLNVDHRNRNGLDNRRENLRFATRSQNGFNTKLFKSNKSGAKGVSWYKWLAVPKWRADIKVNGRKIHLGYFHDKDEAIAARQTAEAKHL